MKIIETDQNKTLYTWPPVRGKVYGLPVDEHLYIGDGFVWRCSDGEAVMQVIGLDKSAREGKRVFAVLD